MVCTRDGRRAYVGCNDGTIRIWDVEQGEEIGQLKDHKGCVLALALSRDEDRLVSGGADKTVRIWDLKNNELLHRCSGHKADVTGVAFSPNGAWVASASSDRTVRAWNVENAQELRRLHGHAEGIRCVNISSDARWIISGGDELNMRLWDMDRPKEEFERAFGGHERSEYASEGDTKFYSCTSSVHFLPNQFQIASLGKDGTLCLWDAETGRERRKLTSGSKAWRLAVSSDGRLLASGHSDGTVRVWLVSHP